jgi:hypothetical protein
MSHNIDDDDDDDNIIIIIIIIIMPIHSESQMFADEN